MSSFMLQQDFRQFQEQIPRKWPWKVDTLVVNDCHRAGQYAVLVTQSLEPECLGGSST